MHPKICTPPINLSLVVYRSKCVPLVVGRTTGTADDTYWWHAYDVTTYTYLIPTRREGPRHVAAIVNDTNQMGVEQIISTENIPDQLVGPEEVIPTFGTPCTSIMVGSIDVSI